MSCFELKLMESTSRQLAVRFDLRCLDMLQELIVWSGLRALNLANSFAQNVSLSITAYLSSEINSPLQMRLLLLSATLVENCSLHRHESELTS